MWGEDIAKQQKREAKSQIAVPGLFPGIKREKPPHKGQFFLFKLWHTDLL